MDFIRRYSWYRGKTNYRPRPEFLESNWGKWKAMRMPFMKVQFKPINAKEFVTVQPMTLGG